MAAGLRVLKGHQHKIAPPIQWNPDISTPLQVKALTNITKRNSTNDLMMMMSNLLVRYLPKRWISQLPTGWKIDELRKLRDITCENGKVRRNIDWSEVEKQFPNHDILDISFQWEFLLAPSLRIGKDPLREFNHLDKFEFTPQVDAKILEIIPKISPYEDLLKRQKAVQAISSDPRLTWKDCLCRYKQLAKDISSEEKAKIIEMHENGKNLWEIANCINSTRTTKISQKDLKKIINSLSSTRISRAFNVIARQQFKVVGPDWKSLSCLLESDENAIKKSIKNTPYIWTELDSSIVSNSFQKSVKHKSRWKSNEISQLLELVDEYKGRKPDWNRISQLMGRCASSCKSKYKDKLMKLDKQGNYTSEEDFMILTAWKKFGASYKRYVSELPKRPSSSIASRLNTLLTNFRDQKEPGYSSCLELGISVANLPTKLKKIGR